MSTIEPSDVAEYLTLVRRGLPPFMDYDALIAVISSLASNPCLGDLVREWKEAMQ